jgi:pyruvate,orthophosphate dikinase
MRALEYRRLEGLGALRGTAVTVQAMVFGNLGISPGSGVAFTRDPSTGQHRLYVDFVLNGQGEDVVAGRDAANDVEASLPAIPNLRSELEAVSDSLEAMFRDAQDFEFTVEEGKLWLLQTRNAKRSPWAALQIACDLVDEGVIDEATALDRLRSYDLATITRTRLSSGSGRQPIGRATPAGTGVVTGLIALDGETALSYAEGLKPVLLVRQSAATGDIAALSVCRGLLTATGARTSHAAVVARQLGVVCLVNCPDLSIDLDARTVRIGEHQFAEGACLTLDGGDGSIYSGAVEVVEEHPEALVRRVRGWQRSLSDVEGPAYCPA